MKTTDYLRMGLEFATGQALALIEDMKDALLTFPTTNGGNHPLWVLGHLAIAEGQLIQHVMLGRPNPLAHWKELFGPGTRPVADAARYPAFGELMNAFKEARSGTLKVLESLTDADLDRPSKACPPEFQSFVGTVRQCFIYLTYHFAYHAGQVSDARRTAGRKPLFG
jgi:hypothetical protein